MKLARALPDWRRRKLIATPQHEFASCRDVEVVRFCADIMDFLGTGIPLGRYFGINVRLHFTFLIFAYWRIMQYANQIGIGFGAGFVLGLYACILMHEFGHALAARWCDGEANDILLWPLGGLAFVRPAFNPTAHLITTVAGPFVTLMLWLVFSAATIVLRQFALSHGTIEIFLFVIAMRDLNLFLLLFNLIPAFPMDGGRMLRDTIWHFTSAGTATAIAVWLSRVIAALGAVYAIVRGDWWLLLFPVFIFMQSMREQAIISAEAGSEYPFSIRERLARGRRQRTWRTAIRDQQAEEALATFHRCATCGQTEVESPHMDFRVCTDCSNGNEYCPEHLDNHVHV
jgi:Zn-dependent protease